MGSAEQRLSVNKVTLKITLPSGREGALSPSLGVPFCSKSLRSQVVSTDTFQLHGMKGKGPDMGQKHPGTTGWEVVAQRAVAN